MGELAPLVRQTDDGDKLPEVLDYIDSLRAKLGDSKDTVQGVILADRARRETRAQWQDHVPRS